MEKFTIIIPTLDRCETLAHTLETCVAQHDENFRILVSDNLSTDGTRELLERFMPRDSRMDVIRPPKRMSMAAHYEFALDHVKEGFVMLLGSDDGMLPDAMPRARAALRAHPTAQALHGGLNPMYYYSNFFEQSAAGKFFINLEPKEEIWQSREILEKVAREEAGVWTLPYPYIISWVRVSVLNKIIEQTGRRILSPIPDVFLAVAIASQIKEYVHVTPSFCVCGQSSKSIGSSFHPNGDRSIEKGFHQDNDIPFHPKVKHARYLPIMVGDCMLRARDAGLLPSDFPIAWDRLVARAYVDILLLPWSITERVENLAALREQSREFGCEHVLADADRFPPLAQWMAGLPFPLKLDHHRWDLVADTRPLGVTGVHEAAHLAEELFQAVSAGAGALKIGSATPVAWAGWGLLQMVHGAAQLRNQLAAVTDEITRLKQQSRLKAARKSRRWSWLPKWLRR